MRRVLAAILVVVLACAGALGQAATLALVGGTILAGPEDEPIRDGVVLVKDGVITAVGGRGILDGNRPAETIDCTGFVIVAGFWNSHVHFFERKWASAAKIPATDLSRQLQDTFLRYGFTSVFDLSSSWENTRRVRERIESGEVAGPRIRSTGEALVSPGVVPSDQVLATMGIMKAQFPEVKDAAAVSAAARKNLEAGVDGIKLFLKSASADAPSFPEGGIAAAVTEAHRAKKPVFVHPTTAADLIAAARDGVDVIAHTTPQSGPWDESVLGVMKERKVALIPTLAVWKFFMRHDAISVQEKSAAVTVGQLRAWDSSGGTVLFGTDLGALDPDPSEEFAMMAEAGMTARRILASLTTAPCDRFGESNCGRVAPGFRADLVVLKDDPMKAIRAFAGVKLTVRSGKVVYRSKD